MHGFRGDWRQLAFLALLLIYALSLLLSLDGLLPGAQIFPLIVLSGAGLLWAVKLIATLAPPGVRAVIEPQGILPRLGSTREPASEEPDTTGWRRSPWTLWLWLLGSLAAMYALGFLAGSALSIFVSMRLLNRASWRATLLTLAATLLFIQLVFAEALRVDLAPPLLTWLQTAAP